MITLDVVDFKSEIKRIKQEVESLALDSVHDKIDYATQQLRIVTPVDTGEAREGWKNKKTNSLTSNQTGEIYNDVEHISYLNNGHSKQAPRYFIERVLLETGLL